MMKLARLTVLALVIAAPVAHASVPIPAQLRIAYRVAMPVPASHLFEVEMDVDGVRGTTLPLQLPVWSTGRYARFDFAKNIQDLKVTTAGGRTLAYDKTNGSRWVVRTGGSRSVRLRYRVFANSLSGTFSVLDTAHANWNGAALFMYVENRKQDPVTLTIAPPPGWQVMNGDGYTELDVERAASDVAGENMRAWFEQYVGGTADLDYDAMLARLGLRLVREGSWRIEEVANASAEQLRIRDGWVTGRRN